MNKDNEKKVDEKKTVEQPKAPTLEKISTKELGVIAVGTGAVGGHRAG